MDLIGLIVIVSFLILLLYAAISDWKKGQIANWIWTLNFFGIPLTIYRMLGAGLLVFYLLQIFIVFVFVLGCFHFGLLGGADGKAILTFSSFYPWLVLDLVSLFVTPFLILLGGLIITGIQSVFLAVMNIRTWNQFSASFRLNNTPKRKRYWFTRRLKSYAVEEESPRWEPVHVPLITYFLFVYLLILSLTYILIIFVVLS